MERNIIDICGDTIHEYDMYGKEVHAGDILGTIRGGGSGGFSKNGGNEEFIAIELWKMPKVHRGGGTESIGLQTYRFKNYEFGNVYSSQSWLIESVLIKEAFNFGRCSFDIKGACVLEDEPKGHTEEIESKIEKEIRIALSIKEKENTKAVYPVAVRKMAECHCPKCSNREFIDVDDLGEIKQLAVNCSFCFTTFTLDLS